jgi:hypothetical protein
MDQSGARHTAFLERGQRAMPAKIFFKPVNQPLRDITPLNW